LSYTVKSSSILPRSLFSIVANILRVLATSVSAIVIAKGLGAHDYGIYAFLLASFAAVKGLVDMGSSNAFYTFASESIQSKFFYLYYLSWVILQFLISAIVIFLLFPSNWFLEAWNGVDESRVAIAFVAVFMQQHVWKVVSQIGEAARLTIQVQTLNILIAVLHLGLVLALYLLGFLTIESIYAAIILEIIISTFVAYFLISIDYSQNYLLFGDLMKKYWVYCAPLIPYMWLVVVMKFADTWFLQRYAGAIEQGYYAISAQFASVSMLITTAVIQILWKEFSLSNKTNNVKKVYEFYDQSSRILFVISAFFSCFFMPWLPDLVSVLLGQEYIDGLLVMFIMFLYPVHQTLAQVVSTTYYSLSLTRQLVMINSAQIIIAMAFMYFMLAPQEAFIPGMNLGSLGLAIKMFVIQFTTVNLLMWTLARKFGWKYSVLPQLLAIASFLIISFAVRFIVDSLDYFFEGLVVKIIISAFFYLSTVIFLLRYLPQYAGMNKKDIQKYIAMIRTLYIRTITR